MHARIAEFAAGSSSSEPTDVAHLLERIATVGFDTVLCSDADRVGVPIDALASAAAAKGLACWLVVSPDSAGAPVFAPDAAPPVAPWMVDGDVALDPRRPPLAVRPGVVADDAAAVAAWSERLAEAAAAGVSGFVCRDADRLSPDDWKTTIATVAGATGAAPLRWVAWTAGLPPDTVDALVGAGFDTVCLSTAWWDGRASWIVDETRRAAGASRIAFPTDPFAASAPGAASTDAGLATVATLHIAAALADALLVPQSLWDAPTGADAVAETLRWFAERPAAGPRATGATRIVSGSDAPVTALVRTAASDVRASDRATVVLVNPDATRTASIAASIVTTALSGFGRYREAFGGPSDDPAPRSNAATPRTPFEPGRTIVLEPGEARVYEAVRLPAVSLPVVSGRRSAEAAVSWPRVAIEAISPAVERGRFPVKRIAGEPVRVEADIVIDGHEKLAASLLYRAAGDRDWRQVRMEPVGNDRFAATFPLERVGRHEYTIEAWRDVFATYRNELEKKSAAGLDVTLELTEGRILVERSLEHARTLKRPNLVRRLTALVKALTTDAPAARGPSSRDVMAARVAALLSSQTLADLQDADHREFAVRPDVVFPVDAERSGAGFAAWYELFPRSLGNRPGEPAEHHGTFDDVIERIPAVKAMGFDVLYFPPIHPIGVRNRKGRNNSLTALEGDPGSPYAIGSPDGGHDALHPQLGTFDDFRRMRDVALENGLELALDFAIQCSPDHPWLKDHPGWFAWRPDGSLRYAENPPKKYEDIVNVDFYGSGKGGAKSNDSPPALWTGLRDVILLWVEQGVKIFRVDNPHTKPLPFWEWMIGEVRARHPDTIFLSEAFTRPKVMYRLAKVGFSQSYTYFTWRHTKQEFIDYLTELTGPDSKEQPGTAPRDFFRPHFFVNTPDINPVFLQRSGRPGFLIRAALAATLSGLWGVYSGFELCEATPVPGKEDYLDSEKYQLRAWDWQRPGNIVAEVTALNRIRNENPALRTHLNVRFEVASDPNILFFSKATEDRSNVVLVAVNLDPFAAHETDFELPLYAWDKTDDAAVDVTDLVDGRRFRWEGKHQRMRLDPAVNPYAIWRVRV